MGYLQSQKQHAPRPTRSARCQKGYNRAAVTGIHGRQGVIMAVVTILGAGYMGAALSFPALENGHEVRLWGTWLDDPLIDAVRIGHEHPRLEMAMLPALQTYKHKELAQALDGADLLICAVTSEGIARVM